jgi:F-type H+-transporting ATPase subunit epsilon
MKLSFEIVTLDGLKFQEDVWQVELPTPEGYIAVLPHHIPLLGVVSPGVIRIMRRAQDREEAVEQLATEGGFVEVDGKRVRLLADSAEYAEEIDELKAKEALEKGLAMRAAAKDQVSLSEAVGLIERQTARLKVAELKHRRRKKA